MRSNLYYSLLAIAVTSALLSATPAMAGSVVADGAAVTPAPGTYGTTRDGEPAFHALNGGSITAHGDYTLSTSGKGAPGIRVEGAGTIDVKGGAFHVSTTGESAFGVHVAAAALTSINSVIVHTAGSNAVGLWLENGGGAVSRSLLVTEGHNAVGLRKDGGQSLTVSESTVGTKGKGAVGVLAVGGMLWLNDGYVQTEGNAAHALVSRSTAEVSLHGMWLTARGEDAWAAVVDDASKLQIRAAQLESQQAGGVWVRGGQDARLLIAEGSGVSAGSGIAVSVDAAVMGRFTVVLDDSSLIGDIVFTHADLETGLTPLSNVHVDLSGGASWQGGTGIADSVTLNHGRWSLSNASKIGTLQARNGSRIDIGHHKLIVDGDLDIEDTYVEFGVRLEGDDSEAGRLHIRGDALGHGTINVRRLSGSVGAQTKDGIPLIGVDGASSAVFTLDGRAVAGNYEYFLHKGGVPGGEGNWYLRSELPTPPDPCLTDPAAPGCVPVDPTDPTNPIDPVNPVNPIMPPRQVLRPEVGAYLANQSAALGMFSHRLADRQATFASDSARHAWARIGRQKLDFSAVGGQLSVDGDGSVLHVGSDLLRKGDAAVGIMLGSGRTTTAVVSGLTEYSAKGQVNGNAIGVYATWLQNAGEGQGAYVDASVQHGRFRNSVHGIGLLAERYDSRMTSASVEGGYTVPVWNDAAAALFIQPQLQLSYGRFRADRHAEDNGTAVDNADAGGPSGRLGLRVFGHASNGFNQVQPYLGVNWLRTSTTSRLDLNGEAVGADVPRNRYEVEAGAELLLGDRIGAWGGMNVQRGQKGYRSVGAQLGLHLSW